MVRISYEKFRLLLVKKRLEWKDIKIIFGWSSRTIVKLKQDEPVRMDILLQICEYFECDISDIMEIKHSNDNL